MWPKCGPCSLMEPLFVCPRDYPNVADKQANESEVDVEHKNKTSPISTACPHAEGFRTFHHYRLVMTGLEVIGALASIAQVGQYTISIIASLVRLYGTLEAAPRKFRSGCQQLDQLCETVVLIQHNTALQTKNILAHADMLAEQIIILDKMLKDMLLQTKQSRFKRVARAYMGYQSEARVAEVFAQVEMKKSALVLSVLEVNTHMTSAILNKVDALQTMSLNTSTPSSPTDSNMSGSTLREHEQSEKSFIQEELNYHIYKGVVSTEDAIQINGDVGQPPKIWFKNHYTDIKASGKSVQLNGNISAVELDAFINRTGNKR